MTDENAPQITDITEGSLIDKLLRHGTTYFIGSLVLGFTSLLLLPINTRIFSASEYGAIATIDSFLRLFGIFVGLSLTAAYTRFYHEYKNDEHQLRIYTSTIFWFIIVWGLITTIGILVFLFLFPTSVKNIPIWPTLTIALFSPLLLRIGYVTGDYLRQNHRSTLQVSLNLMYVFTHVIIMLILVSLFSLGLIGKYIAMLCGAGVFATISIWILYKEKLIGFHFSLAMLKESLIFSIPLIPNVASGWIAGLSDRLILTWYGSLEETAVYSAGYTLGRGISVFSGAILMVYGPMIYAMLRKNPDIAKKRIERFIAYFFIFMLWIYLALALFSKEIIVILIPDSYASAATVLPVVMFAYFLGTQYKVFVNILGYKKRTWIISAGAILMAITNLVANLLLIPYFGKMAAAWTTVLGVSVYMIWLFIWSQKTFHLQLNYKQILMASVIIMFMGGTTVTLSSSATIGNSLFISIGFKVTSLLTILVLLWIFGCILPVDKQQLKIRFRHIIGNGN